MRVRRLAVGAILPLLLWLALPVLSTGAPGASRVDALQKRIDRATRKLAHKRGTERVLTGDITAYTRRISHLEDRIAAYDARIERLQVDLDRKRTLLTAIQSDLRSQRARVARLRTRLATGRRMLAVRLRELYQADRPDLVTVVLNAKGFAQLLERMDFIGRISAQDRQVVTLVRDAKAEATSAVDRLARAERRQRAVTAAVLERRNDIASSRTAVASIRTGLAAARSHKRRALSSVKVSRQHLESEVAGLRAQQAKIQRTLQAAAARATGLPAQPVSGSGGGPLIWPVSGPITSPFCERRAWESCHPGLDIGVPEGTPIRAAASGRVVLLQPTAASGGYGNYTCLQHSSTMSTCYAHQQRFGTSMGATVSQGQVIGYVGNTGHSFGAHLHFEVRVNGAVVNPLNYL